MKSNSNESVWEVSDSVTAVEDGKRMFRDNILRIIRGEPYRIPGSSLVWKGRVMVVTVNENPEDIKMLPDLDDAIRGNRLK